MNKKLIAVAVAAGMAAPMVAMADIKMSGRVSQDFVLTSDDALDDDRRRFEDAGTARLQFDGSQPAGDMTMFGRLAFDMRGNAPTYRERYVGLRGGFGALQLGRMNGALKNVEGDPFITTFLQCRATSACGGTAYGSNAFVNDMIQYSNSFGNVSVLAQYNPNTATVNGSEEDVSDAALLVRGKFGGVNVWAGWNNAADTNDNMKVGANMKFGPVNATVQYETREGWVDGVSNPANFGDRIYLTGTMGFGGGLSGNLGVGQNVDAETTWFRLAVQQAWTGNAKVYAGITQDERENGDAIQKVGVGMEVRF